MAPTKRPATSAAGPKTKKAKGPSVAKQCKEISSAMKGAEGYPPLVVKMISENLAVCLGDYKEERHEFQASVASMAEKIMASIKVSIEAKIKESEETLAKADTEKAAREAAVEETKKLAEDSTAACAAAKQEVTTTEAELKKAQEELKTAEKEQKAGDAQSVKDETKKGKLENTINAVFVPCKEGALEKAAITKGISELQKLGKELDFDTALLTSLPSALQKDPASRGTFDNVVVTNVEDELQKRLAKLKETLAEAAPAREERASKAFGPEIKATGKALKDAKDSLEDFTTGAMTSFTELLNRTKPLPEPEVPAEAEAPAAAS